MSVSYTQAGFAVSSLYSDTSSPASLNVAIPNINWAGDFSAVASSAEEAKFIGTSGSALTQYEQVKLGRQDVANVYTNTGSAMAAQLPDKRGVQVMVELRETYQAISSATGAAYDLPCTARLTLRLPYNAVLNKALIEDVALRCVGMMGSYVSGEVTTKDADHACANVVSAVSGDLMP